MLESKEGLVKLQNVVRPRDTQSSPWNQPEGGLLGIRSSTRGHRKGEMGDGDMGQISGWVVPRTTDNGRTSGHHHNILNEGILVL